MLTLGKGAPQFGLDTTAGSPDAGKHQWLLGLTNGVRLLQIQSFATAALTTRITLGSVFGVRRPRVLAHESSQRHAWPEGYHLPHGPCIGAHLYLEWMRQIGRAHV